MTDDRATGGEALARRTRRLGVQELVAGTLLRYPVYWNWELRGYATCEAVLAQIVETRNDLEVSGKLDKPRVGLVRRQVRKLQVVARAWLGWGKE